MGRTAEKHWLILPNMILAVYCLLLPGLLLFAPVAGGNIEKEKIYDGLKQANSFAFTMAIGSFTEVLRDFTKTIAPWLETHKLLSNFFLMFFPGEDEHMLAMNKGFSEVNSRLDDIKDLLEDVIEAIDWTVVKIKYSVIEQKILTMTTVLEDCYRAPNREHGRQKFRFLYLQTYGTAGIDLYESIANDYWVFQDNILRAGMKYTDHTREKMHKLMKGLISLLMKASALEIANERFAESNTGMVAIWTKRLENVQKIMAETDEALENKWKELMPDEMDALAEANQGVSHSEFADAAYKFFSNKYYWLNWYVISYDQLSTYKEHAARTSMIYSHLRFRWFGRNYAVSTRPKDYNWDRSIALKWLKNQECTRPRNFCYKEPAKVLNEMLPTGYAVARHIIKEKSSWAWRAPAGRTVHDHIALWGHGGWWPFFVIYFG